MFSYLGEKKKYFMKNPYTKGQHSFSEGKPLDLRIALAYNIAWPFTTESKIIWSY